MEWNGLERDAANKRDKMEQNKIQDERNDTEQNGAHCNENIVKQNEVKVWKQ